MKKPDDEYVLRIIGGTLKGKGINIKSQKGVRPTKSIIKESLFNHLGAEVMGCTFVEMFAGSGSIGIEAYSRGAQMVYLIEQDRMALEFLRKNLKHLDIMQSISVIEGDTFQVLPKVLESNNNIFLYCDPPFPVREQMQNIYEQSLMFLERYLNGRYDITYLICEMMSDFAMPLKVGDFTCYRSRKFGKTTLHHYSLNKES